MRVKELRLNDFGIFDQQALSDINSNIVVIGGYNRAGKTTLMQALRYMGYGFPKDNKMVYKRKEYDVSFDVDIDGETYRCVVKGHREPNVYGLSTTQALNQSLYPIDPFTYRQLFTLDINQLKPVPSSVQSKEKEQLKSILLGAGLKELTILPQLRKQFDNEAKKIGATKGNPTTKQFAPYAKNIDEQEKKLADAIKDVNRYQALKQELKSLQKQISQEKQTIDLRQSSMDYLKLLMNHYDLYIERKNILAQLDMGISKEEAEQYPDDKILTVKQHWRQYNELQQALKMKLQHFSIQTGQVNTSILVYSLVKHRDKINGYFNQMSGLKTRLEQWEEGKKSIEKAMFHTQEMLQSINEHWRNELLDNVKALPLNDINHITLNETVNQWRTALAEKEKQEESIKRLHTQLETMGCEISGKKKQLSTGLQWIMAILIVLVGGMVGGLSHPFYGLLVGVVGGLTLFARTMSENKAARDNEVNRRQRQTIQTERAILKQQVEVLQSKIDQLEAKLDDYRDWLRVDWFASPAVIETTFASLQRIQMDCYRLDQQVKMINHIRVKCEQHLAEMERGVQPIEPFDQRDSSSITLLDRANDLMLHVEKLYHYCQPAIELSVLADHVAKEKETLIKLTGEGNERYFKQHVEQWLIKGEETTKYKQLTSNLKQVNRQILRLFENDANMLVWEKEYNKKHIASKVEQFNDAYNQYLSMDEIEAMYNQHQTKQTTSKAFLNNHKESMIRLQQQIDHMATDSKILTIQQKIDQSRAALKPLAYRYAVLRTAEYLLNKVEVEKLDTMKETLLKQSSDIFERITSGEYCKIYPSEGLIGESFAIINKDDEHFDTVDKMSRGTMEQLFLSVRLSRIKEIEHALPIIIDDSFVNFDYHHICQTISIINELSQTHQVFIMTCHSALVNEIDAIAKTAQFYQLERGVFNESTGDELAKYLGG